MGLNPPLNEGERPFQMFLIKRIRDPRSQIIGRRPPLEHLQNPTIARPPHALRPSSKVIANRVNHDHPQPATKPLPRVVSKCLHRLQQPDQNILTNIINIGLTHPPTPAPIPNQRPILNQEPRPSPLIPRLSPQPHQKALMRRHRHRFGSNVSDQIATVQADTRDG